MRSLVKLRRMDHARTPGEKDRAAACTAAIASLSKPRIRRRSVLASMLVPILCTTLARAQVSMDATRKLELGERLGNEPLQGLNGPSRRLQDFRGHPLIINLWASWCGPCVREMASLERLAWRKDRPRFNIIGISTDDDAAAARRLLAATNATIAHFIDSHQHWETLLGASRIPLTVLVDSSSRVVERIYGARQWDSEATTQLIGKAFGSDSEASP